MGYLGDEKRRMFRTTALTFTAFWTRNSVQDTESHVKRCVEFFQAAEPGARVNVSNPTQLWNGSYGDCIYQAAVTVRLNRRVLPAKLEAVYFSLVRQWCANGKKEQSPRFLQWLAPDRKNGFLRGFTTFERNVQLASVEFGAFAGLTTFARCAAVNSGVKGVGYMLSCVFKHDVRALSIFLTLQHTYHCGKADDTYKMEISYENIVRVVVDDSEGGVATTGIYLHLSTFPLLFKKVEDRESDGQGKTANESPNEFPILQSPEFFLYERALELGCFCTGVTESSKLGGNFVVVLNFRNKFKARQILGRLSLRCDAGTAFVYTSMTVRDVSSKLEEMRVWFESKLMPEVAYECCYALCALILQSSDLAAQLALLSEEGLLETFAKAVLDLANENEAALERALFVVSTDLEGRSILSVPRAIEEAFHKLSQNFVPYKLPPGSCLVRRIFLLPSRLLLLPPSVHTENRVLRTFETKLALRLTIRDDNFQPLSHSLAFHTNQDEVMDTLVGKPLREGIWIGKRQFKLLASSSSQLRDHGAWLYALATRGLCPEGIRKWMGDFSEITNIAKRMARMGLCFSSTEATVKVPLGVAAVTEPDIVGGRHPKSGKPYVFSDGIGMVSSSVLRKVCDMLEIEDKPSAIQVRYAGFKGVLCLNPELPGDRLVLRESMRKFPCHTSDVLEVIKVSAPRTVCLNRPLITILEQLGVPGHTFVNLQQSMMLELVGALVCERTALRVLNSYVETPFLFAEFQRRGLHLTQHPFVRLLLCTIYKNAMDGLRTKSRIAVPPSAGRNMLGVLDETRKLRYSEVFVQYTELGTKDRQTHICTGTVLVTKCPCLHPGDVRLFTAIDVPELHHIKDCIVFPATGPRPHPDEMAGSDLDGDEYVVIWLKDLFFPGPNHPPMTFTDHAATSYMDGNLEEAMIQFICNYIKNDTIGVMSSAHLAWADQLPEGIFSKCCLRLADKISVCLDFAKTGAPSRLEKKEKPRVFPDFMEKGSHKNTYQSKRILGQLYRLLRSLEAVVSTDFRSNFVDSDCQRALFEFAGWEVYKDFAEQSLDYYASEMGRILNQYGIKSEGEVVTGLVNKVSDVSKSRKEKTNVETLVAKQYQHLVKMVRQRFVDDLNAACRARGISTVCGRKIAILQMVSAWYMVAYNSGTCGKQHSFGFPWAVANTLLVLFRTRTIEVDVSQSPRNFLVSKINDALAKEMEDVRVEDKALEVITQWAVKDELVKDSKSKPFSICKTCLTQIFQVFVKSKRNGEQLVMSNGSSDLATSDRDRNGELSATAGDLVVGFFKHMCSAAVEFPPCSRCKWSASMTRTITMAAVRTYSLLAITRDLCHVGLPCEPTLHEPLQLVQEGNPVRIEVDHQGFISLLQHSTEEVERLLSDWTGVQEVHIRGDATPRSRCLMVSAVGRDWQRWFLEELVLQPWLAEAVLTRNLEPFLRV